MSLHQWNISSLLKTDLSAKGQVAAHADCVYQYTGRYKYAIVLDLDELIVPYDDTTLPQLLSRLESQTNLANLEEKGIVKKMGSFSFVNAFFPLERSDDSEWMNTSGRTMSTYPALALRKTQQLLRLTHVPER